jgi:uncharacterized protein (TIGR02271 family)
MSKASKDRDGDVLVVPLQEEEATVTRREVEGDRVRVEKLVRERKAHVDEMLMREDVEVERVAVDMIVAEPPPAREENGVLVIPLVEEAVVVERRLILREEVRVRHVRSSVRHREEVPLRSEEARITRIPADRKDAESGRSATDHPRSETKSSDEEL